MKLSIPKFKALAPPATARSMRSGVQPASARTMAYHATSRSRDEELHHELRDLGVVEVVPGAAARPSVPLTLTADGGVR